MKKKSNVRAVSNKKESTRSLMPISERDIAIDFATKAHQRFDRLIKASVLFGSQAKNTADTSSDIDIVLIIDDAAVSWDLELIAWYREELGKLIAAQKYARELHINTIKLTTWWQDLLYGDAVVINILRYGEPLIDSGGFFLPLKALLQQGKIRATHEAVYTSLERAPTHLARSKFAHRGAVEGIYWCLVESAQAALMTAGKLPPSPEQIAPLLSEVFVSARLLRPEQVRFFSDVFVAHKEVSHGATLHVHGEQLDRWQVMAESFLSDMTTIIQKLLENKGQS